MSALHKAAWSGDVDKVRELLEDGKYDVNCTDASGRTPLHYACSGGHVGVVRLLIDQYKADLEAKTRKYNTPLHVAVLSGIKKLALVLINEFHCDITVKGNCGRSVLHNACYGGNVELVCTLIRKHGADITARDDLSDTPLHVAAIAGQKEVALLLINEFDCDITVKGNFGRSVLHSACSGGNVDLVHTLMLDHGADTTARDNNNDTPLNVAAFSGQRNAALALINEFECDITVKGNFGRSVLHNACFGGNVDLVRTLILKHGADTTARDDHNDTPLHVAAFCGQKEIALLLINEFHCDITVKGSFGRSVLHNACYGGNADLVCTLILQYGADYTARDDENNTPLHVAAFRGHKEVLINEFCYDITFKGKFGRPLLHCACYGGNVDLVRTLILTHGADIAARDDQKNVPLHVAALAGKKEAALILINEFHSDFTVKGNFGRSVLHSACNGGNTDLVRTLILEHEADINARDNVNDTPLHVAALAGKQEIVLVLINEFHCDVTVKGNCGRSVLHSACNGGNVDLVRTLILEHGANTSARDDKNDMPHNVAAFCGQKEVTLLFINKFHCDITIKANFGRSLLHNACYGGNVDLVRTLILEHGADTTARDNVKNAPLHVAALAGQKEVGLLLINEFDCDITVKGNFGRSILHSACNGGNVDLVRTLILEHGADTTARDDQNDTPLHVAASACKQEVALVLINEFNCDVTVKGSVSRSVLHSACYGGNVNLVHTLILKHGADITARDSHNDTPLHVAAFHGQEKVAFHLINEFHCDVTDKNKFGRSVLHNACYGGSVNLVRTLILEHGADITGRDYRSDTPLNLAAFAGKLEVILTLVQEFNASLTDGNKDGDTPLHLCAAEGYITCVNALLSANAPILLRNKSGKTSQDMATSQDVKLFLDGYIRENKRKLYAHYEVLGKLAMKKYSSAKRITRIFVIGNSGAGKSTLVENLRRDSFFNILRVTESAVPPHTAGIIPSIHTSKHYGRVLFFDFAGDPEYYSSHAAILENFTSSLKGDNIFIIVVDLREDTNELVQILHYWLSFIRYQEFVKNPYLIIIGSHSDETTPLVTESKRKLFVTFCEEANTSSPLKAVSCFLLDCGKPNSAQIGQLRKQVADLTKGSPRYELSSGARILLGLLEKDFSNVTTCSIQSIVSHIENTGVHLPTKLQLLSSLLDELHAIGLLFITRTSRRLSLQSIVMLNISELTHEVHRCLFSLEAKTKLSDISTLKGFTSNFNLGIIPEHVLLEILPEHIPKECLIQLQYCHEITYEDVAVFPSVTLSEDQIFLFFPALCTADKSDVSWATNDYSISWLARCTDPRDSFPPRFLHVLLLRLVFRFALPLPTANQDLSVSPDHSFFQRRCTMWRTGVHWLMAEGVECLVELVGTNQVVVITKSDEDLKENCVSVFNRLINCVMEAKAEFCHSIRPQFFLLDSTDSASYLSDKNLFAMKEVEEALYSSSKKAVVSLDGKRFLKCDQISFLRKLTHWDSIFPLDFSLVLHHLKDIVDELFELGLQLNISPSVLKAFEIKYSTNFNRGRRELVREWLSSSLDPPCWWHLIEALRKVEREDVAGVIERKYNVHVRLEEILLSAKESLKPDEGFLEEFAGVVESKWPSLASILSLTSAEIEEVRRKGEELSQRDSALLMLRQWARREDATFGQLRQRLKTISMFHH